MSEKNFEIYLLKFFLLLMILKQTSGIQLYNDTTLLPERKNMLGDSCIRDKDCYEILHAKCSADGICICRPNNIRVNPTSCQPSLGSFCWKDEKCTTNHSVCIDNECRCGVKYLQSDDQCLTIIGSPCITDFDCEPIQFSYCSENRVCSCLPATIAINNDTLCSPRLNLYCNSDQECEVNNSECIDNQCRCKSHYENIRNLECKERYLGSTCHKTVECEVFIRNSKCSQNYKCVCEDNYHTINNQTCKLVSNIEAYCNEDSECPGIGLECHNSKCVCKDNYLLMNSTTCVPLLGSYCSKNEDCAVKNSVCIDNRCLCESEYFSQSRYECVLEGSYTLGKTCATDTDCQHLKNSRCSTDNVCVCQIDYFAVDKFSCVSTSNEFCLHDIDCYFDSFHCFLNRCLCKSNYTAVSKSQCVETHSLSSCDDDTECSNSWHSACSAKGKCVCAYNNMAVSASTCLPLLNGYCWRNDQCQVKNSVCIDFRCKCEKGFIAIANNLCRPIN